MRNLRQPKSMQNNASFFLCLVQFFERRFIRNLHLFSIRVHEMSALLMKNKEMEMLFEHEKSVWKISNLLLPTMATL